MRFNQTSTLWGGHVLQYLETDFPVVLHLQPSQPCHSTLTLLGSCFSVLMVSPTWTSPQNTLKLRHLHRHVDMSLYKHQKCGSLIVVKHTTLCILPAFFLTRTVFYSTSPYSHAYSSLFWTFFFFNILMQITEVSPFIQFSWQKDKRNLLYYE